MVQVSLFVYNPKQIQLSKCIKNFWGWKVILWKYKIVIFILKKRQKVK